MLYTVGWYGTYLLMSSSFRQPTHLMQKFVIICYHFKDITLHLVAHVIFECVPCFNYFKMMFFAIMSTKTSMYLFVFDSKCCVLLEGHQKQTYIYTCHRYIITLLCFFRDANFTTKLQTLWLLFWYSGAVGRTETKRSRKYTNRYNSYSSQFFFLFFFPSLHIAANVINIILIFSSQFVYNDWKIIFTTVVLEF